MRMTVTRKKGGPTHGTFPAISIIMKSSHLRPDGDRWKLTGEADDMLEMFDTKEEALVASATFMQDLTGRLEIHRTGPFEKERTYPRSLDPAGTPG
jgi:hypothetical protein